MSMKRLMLALAVLCAAASFPILGCSDDNVTDTGRDDGHADDIARDDTGADADGDGDDETTAEDVVGEDAEAETGPCGASTCVNDPADGPIGLPCLDDTECETALTCWTESSAAFHGFTYFSDIGGYCVTYGAGTAGCDPDVTSSCPTGSKCTYMGTNSSTGLVYYGCMDSCSVASRLLQPWTNNCDCRDGYECELMNQVCMSGCSNDHECCEIWHDGEGGTRDGVRQEAEVVDLPASECTDTCDLCNYRCTLDGCPAGSECTIGGACEHDSDCPADSVCYSEFGTRGRFIGGICAKYRCDLAGRECPIGGGCADLGSTADPWVMCVVPCTAATVPGAAGYPCRDIDPPGPSVGDYACVPLRTDDWVPVRDETGFCWAGNFGGPATTPMYAACLDNPECESPFGLGTCINLVDTPKFCTASCNQTVAETGACGAADPPPPVTGGIATGVCASGVCVEACDPAVTGSCAGVAKACYPIAPFGPGTYAFAVTGSTMPAGVCWPRCLNDAWCLEMWGSSGGACNTATGVCGL
jgi:hypothetical protein